MNPQANLLLPALRRYLLAVVLVLAATAWASLGGACGPKAPPDSPSDTASPIPPAAPSADAGPAAAAPEPFVWLAWRQDAGGMATTALIVDRRLGAPPEVLEVNRALFVPAAGEVWSLSPLAERWPLAPCGQDAPGLARGLRFRALGLADEDELPPEPMEHRWSVEGRRPGPGESATHEEVLIFLGQVGDLVLIRHITRGDTCPVPAGSSERTELVALDLRRGELVPSVEALPEPTRRELAERHREEAARRIAEARADLEASSIAAKLRLEALDLRDTPAGRSVQLIFVGDDPIFAQLEDPSGMVPSSVRAHVPITALPLELSRLAAPPPVKAFWAAREVLDASRTEGVGDAALYGTVGWAEVPVRLLPGVRAALLEIRDAPTPDGPTDWD